MRGNAFAACSEWTGVDNCGVLIEPMPNCTRLDLTKKSPVCTENLVRFDLTTESLNVDRDGRADSLALEPGCLALQAQEPA